MIGSTKQECLVELNFRRRIDCDEARKELRLQVESYEVNGVATELMIMVQVQLYRDSSMAASG